MARSKLRICLLTMIIVFAAVQQGGAAEAPCPADNNDGCDKWYFEQADKELTDVVTAALKPIETFANPETKQEAKAKLVEAHRAWTAWRELECQAKSAWIYMNPSARTRVGYTSSCMASLTAQRIKELKERYRMK